MCEQHFEALEKGNFYKIFLDNSKFELGKVEPSYVTIHKQKRYYNDFSI